MWKICQGSKLKNILVIDENIIQATYELLIRGRYRDLDVSFAESGEEALKKINKIDCTMILSEIKLPEMSGIEFHKQLKKDNPNLAERLGFITSDISSLHSDYCKEERCPSLEKPFDAKGFFRFINNISDSAMEQYQSRYGYEWLRGSARLSTKTECIISPTSSDSGLFEPINAEVFDYSEGGLGIRHKYKFMLPAKIFNISAKALDITNRRAKATWLKPVEGGLISGLQWM